MKMHMQLVVLITGLASICCAAPSFHDETLVAHMSNLRVPDASGLAASRKHRGVLYTHNDGDTPEPFVYAINASNAAIISTLRLFPAENHDWEDIAVGPCGDRSCIYVGDSSSHKLYRVEEPEYIHTDQILTDVLAVHTDWSHKFDTLMIDRHGNAYVVRSYTDHDRLIGRLSRDAWSSSHTVKMETFELPHLHNLDSSDPKSGDISADGTQLLLLTSKQVYYWKVDNDDVISTLRHNSPTVLPTKTHGVVDGICWDQAGVNYYEIAESHHAGAPLYIFNRR